MGLTLALLGRLNAGEDSAFEREPSDQEHGRKNNGRQNDIEGIWMLPNRSHF